MKKYLLLIVLLIPLLFIKIPNYLELNNLIIVEEIKIDCKKNIIYYKEIIPIRDDNDIENNYKIHKYKLSSNYKKNNIYLKGVKKITSNCPKKELKKIKEELS